ncbi:MAG: hypothetical protein ACXADL_08670 [Candidatus Thorarchaeota archaeon]|jgi:hypothetical protein
MTKLNVISEFSFKEGITGVDLIDITGDGKDELVLFTLNGDLLVLEVQLDDEPKLNEVCRSRELPPVAALGLGDVTGNGTPDFIVGGLDNELRVIVYNDGKLEVIDSTPLGTLPTALVIANVMNDESAEVIVATNDKTLRCYGWFEGALDKLAHKVVEHPVFSMRPLRSKGIPYSRFVFGDDSEYLYTYQYADDRLHEISRGKVKGEVNLVATGSITGGRNDEIATISDSKNLTLFGVGKGALEQLARIRAPGAITSVRIGKFCDGTPSEGQILASQANSKLTLLSYEGTIISDVASVKTVKRAAGSLIAFGDVDGDNTVEIFQAIGNDLYLISVDADEE